MGPDEKQNPRELLIPRDDDSFDPLEALHGSFSTPVHCAKIPGGLWVETDGKGECIRHYAQGIAYGENPLAIVYFGGDVLLRNSKGERFIAPAYAEHTPGSFNADMKLLSERSGLPAIFIARPGTYGSSGDHTLRRYSREIELIDGAIAQIRMRYGISHFILAGQSGGGHIVASLLNRRKDVTAAVISSGLVSVRQVMAYWENRRDIPGSTLYDADAFYDPVDDVAKITREPQPQIILISDRDDRVVPFETQAHYVKELRRAGFQPVHILAKGDGANNHVLSRHLRLAAALVAQGSKPDKIRSMVKQIEPLE
ncbi:prolyl oligopeptidase family serine peptidase [Mesorhizobium sp. SB112]